MSDRIRSVQIQLRRGAPFGTSELAALKVSAALSHEHVKSGWLEKLGRGVFKFPGDELKLDDTLSFLVTKVPGLHVA